MIEVPDLAGPLVAHHAGTNRCPRVADLVKEFTVRRLGDPAEHPVADAGRVFSDVPEDDVKLLLRIVLLKLLFEPEP